MIKKGFTLIELMVVILIIMLLATVITVNVDQARKKARDAKRIADLNTVATAIQSYYADYHVYPGDIASWCEIGECWYPNSKSHYRDIVDIFLKSKGYLSYCPQESNMNIGDCANIPAQYLGPTPLPWGYRYTNWSGTSYALATVVELTQNATMDPGVSGYPEYRLCNGQPWYSGDCK